MRITESQLRRLIKEELLAEGAMTPREARLRGIKFKIKKRESNVEIKAMLPGSRWAGTVSSRAEAGCEPAWTIDTSSVGINGLGPLMYDLMIDVIHPHPLASDRAEVTPDARRVWDYYLYNRDDMDIVELPDDCEQSSAKIWADEVAGGEGEAEEDEWRESSLSKAFMRYPGDGTPLLDELQAMGLVEFI